MATPAQRPVRRPAQRPADWRNIGPWNETGETRDEFAIRTLDIAFDVHFDKDDREFHGDIRYDDLQRKHSRTLASEDGRWRDDETPLEPVKVEDLSIGETYRLRELPLGSKFIMDGAERSFDHYNYAPRPSKGATVKVPAELSQENNGWMINKGVFTDLGNKEVTFLSHPHKRIKPAKSASALRARSRTPSPKAAVKTPSPTPLYKAKKREREKRVLSRKRTRRRKRGSRARTVSADKVKVSKSSTRRRAKSK